MFRKRKEEEYVTEALPPETLYATVVEKGLLTQYHGHHKTVQPCSVRFRADNGEEMTAPVPPELYDDFAVGMRDVLVLQNGNFVGYGDIGAIEGAPAQPRRGWVDDPDSEDETEW